MNRSTSPAGRDTAARAGGGTPDSQRLTLTVVVVAAVAWVLLATTHSASLDHHTLGGLWETRPGSHHSSNDIHQERHGGGSASADVRREAVIVTAAWAVMIVAMMLPPALPLLQLLRKLVSRTRAPGLLVVLGALSFTAVWTAVGVVLILGDSALHAAIDGQEWVTRAPHLVTGVVLLAAGAYQFSPLKTICLRACRTPRSFALAHWRGQHSTGAEVTTLSCAYAVSCVGCCWALMSISFAVGAAALPVMVILAVLMAAERLAAWGHRLVRPAGLTLLGLGLLTVLGVVPTGLISG